MPRIALFLVLSACKAEDSAADTAPPTDSDADTDSDTDTDADTDADTDTDTTPPLPAVESPLVINEVVTSNLTGLQDASLAFPDWVEIWNSGDVEVSLGGVYLTDDHQLPTRFAFSPSAVLAPHAYVVVMCDGDLLDSTDLELHANFSLKSSGEWLALTTDAGVELGQIDGLDLPNIGTDRAYARQPDGGKFTTDSTPTPGAPND